MQLPYNKDKYSERSIHDRMMEYAPEGIDLSEGHMFWDHTRPSAVVLSEYAEFVLPNALMQKWPQTATGPYLDMHGDMIGLPRREATHAEGYVTVEAKSNVSLPAGVIFITYGDDHDNPLYYVSKNNVKLNEGDTEEIAVVAEQTGTGSNIPDNSIDNVEDDYTAVIEVVSSRDIKGAIDDEDDETYRGRILDFWRNRPSSGTVNDYKMWAKEVEGVGDVEVESVWEGGGTVRVLITDVEGKIANEELIKKVQAHIDPVPGKGLGKAPIGAWATVATMEGVTVDIVISNITVVRGRDKDEVAQSIKSNIDNYLSATNYINYNMIVSITIKTTGVNDFSELTINGKKDNIELSKTSRATIGVFDYE